MKVKAENNNGNAPKRKTGKKRRRKAKSRKSRLVKKIKLTARPLLIVAGICFFAALLIVYVTGSIPVLIEKISSRNIANTLKRIAPELMTEELSQEERRNTAKNINFNKVKSELLKHVAGWEGDRGENQVTDDHKDIITKEFGGGSSWGDSASKEQK